MKTFYFADDKRDELALIVKRFKENTPTIPSCSSERLMYGFITDTEIFLDNFMFTDDSFPSELSWHDLLFDEIDMYDSIYKITIDHTCFHMNFPLNLDRFSQLHYLYVNLRFSVDDPHGSLIPSTVRHLVLLNYGKVDLSHLTDLEYLVTDRLYIPVTACPKLKTLLIHEDSYKDQQLSKDWWERIKRDNIHYDFIQSFRL